MLWIQTKGDLPEFPSHQAEFRWEIPAGILEVFFCFRKHPFSINIYGYKQINYLNDYDSFSHPYSDRNGSFKKKISGFKTAFCTLICLCIATFWRCVCLAYIFNITVCILTNVRSVVTTTFRNLSAVDSNNKVPS